MRGQALEDQTQQEVADELDWSRSKVSRYNSLSRISSEAWDVIVTTVTNNVTAKSDGHTGKGTFVVTFSERLLRTIVPLTDDQQEHLVKGLANRGMTLCIGGMGRSAT